MQRKKRKKEKEIIMVKKKLDNLESSVDSQYKSFVDNTDYVKIIDSLQYSFMYMLDALKKDLGGVMPKQTDIHDIALRMDSLESSFEGVLSRIENEIKKSKPRLIPSPS